LESNNIIEIISTTINTIFSNLFSSIDNELYGVIDDIVFINKDIITDSHFESILGTNTSEGILLICNALIIGFILYYGVSLLFSHLTFAENIRPTAFIFRVIVFSILLNCSPFICELLIELISNISLAIRNIGETLFDTTICFATLLENLNLINNLEGFNLFTFDGLVKALISFGFINLTLSYSLRYIMVKVLILICPFAILSLSVDKFSWIFKSWIKLFLSSLFLQILVSVILVVTFSLNIKDTLFSALTYLGSIYALIKANTFIRDFMGGLSTDVNIGISNLKSNS